MSLKVLASFSPISFINRTVAVLLSILFFSLYLRLYLICHYAFHKSHTRPFDALVFLDHSFIIYFPPLSLVMSIVVPPSHVPKRYDLTWFRSGSFDRFM